MIDKWVWDISEHYLFHQVQLSFELAAAAVENVVLTNISVDLPNLLKTVDHKMSTWLFSVRDSLAHIFRMLFESSLKSQDHKAGDSSNEPFARRNQA